MLNKIANRWKTHQQQHTARPAYLLIADIIADGINSGEFQPRDRLPPLRDLAALLAINYTTATRGYAEARRLSSGDGELYPRQSALGTAQRRQQL